MAPADIAEIMKREFVSGGSHAAIEAIRAVLPLYVDDVTRDFGWELYERMLTDDAVSAAFGQRRDAVFSDGIRLEPAAPPVSEFETPDSKRAADAETAEELRAFVQQGIDGMDGDLDEIAEELYDGAAYAYKLMEIVLRPEGGRLTLDAIRGKDPRNMGFVVDEKGHTVGIATARVGGYGLPVVTGPVDSGGLGEILPTWKFLVYRNSPRKGDPRGTSILRSAYDAWFTKTHVLPEYFKYLRQFATPAVIGKTPLSGDDFVPQVGPDGQPVLKDDGQAMLITKEQRLLSALLGWRNSFALAVSGGTEIELVQSGGDGAAFRHAFDYFDRRIFRAILGTDGTGMGASNDSLGAKEIGQDTVSATIRRDKRRLASALTKGVSELLVWINWGQEYIRLAPQFVLSATEQQDWRGDLAAVSDAYAKGFIDDSQVAELDARLGLPKRDIEAIARRRAEETEAANLRAGDLSRVFDPAAEGPP